MDIASKIKKLIEVVGKLGEIGLIIIEDEKEKVGMQKQIAAELNQAGVASAKNYLEVMDFLEKSKAFYYLEETDKLDDLMLEIIAEYKTGIVSLQDRKNSTGLRTVKFNPNDNYFILILSRKQVEASGQFFEFIGPIESF
ncbi:MAG: hypothetical protein US83_C0008G0010 [Candidatus Falkowbacteria bacterium GW2011_GWC2_38_22]|uniref:Uncharacterized protein n=1 Tax=Candidatus Falkowbacteria bacterium GW2011_GWE1_38_31 TaxID=1618638 RepID=A0A0G0K3K7_9BACT|nr:MAG: hypothetical protein US73_C0006G0009 [Candidatus Falkowbacteria bacterium GW2011_GWF2_38_1205]KKQ61169.1 MAG: hypothetical protein US83_C0008G0010 [Candidatus Falkowbacteria bacterium GW2011_GWC2_38_22]KKQ63323.1 MAG: hypothetical protein US84_C0007G0065 [Candidatus Falkowbacteria bacterium GW2011_GWF1_38_22]KKQ65559.1 MAG: hypothetical protein US87_C0006G0009 [Candidatus Falkowbacteria bacterium GW2011_GWE2_38_254]KKQ70055.1 MAG: hypothetical protein US91_C0007G0065 [Candidatus Falkowb